MADKAKGTPSKVTFLKTEGKMVFLKRRGAKESRIFDIPADGDLTKPAEGRLVKTADLDETQTQSYEDYTKGTTPATTTEAPAPAGDTPATTTEAPAPEVKDEGKPAATEPAPAPVAAE